ncbi:MAG: CPBP family intramembrane metalloprotease [Anaerolineae bacterium]|jgi:membrane protease YdiL (CAAX protease family)|nr:CPBP family intramembrane metalloprotease [Anaerolineae bacterium]MBT3712649.1 CPBP family intramembrane metalloprotease [Anaerolineae bacterium]MBT4312247.1 CPBP family intramembrane metalloprotease [Anaerolineae bacterium]MBT6060424.1 CPBP family intramembrane metalloprotease [Anaerolineae bacterium]MBT6322018.1 CPBP family intramembrane metalloprotease [Anaerolineae bacterium]
MKNRKSLITFLLVTFTISWVLFLVPLAFRNLDAQTHQIITTVSFSLAMWGPGIGAIVSILASGGKFSDLNLGRLGAKRYLFWAWLLFPILSVATGLVTLLLGFGQFDPNLTLINDSLAALPPDAGLSPALLVVAQVAAAFTVAPLINMLFAMGEELGWRGFLLPKLLHLGEWKAIIISSVIWGFWHALAIAQGLNYPEHPVLGIFMMVIFTTLLGIIFSWLYLNTQSPWTPALAHGSVNAVASLPVLFLIPDFDLALGGTLASVSGWVVLAVFVIWLIATKRVPVNAKTSTPEDVE